MATPVEGTNNTDPSGSVQGDNTPGPNPAWNDALSAVPEEFHGALTPHFQKWDQAANTRIESLNKQYEPYKAFIDHGITPDTLTQGLGILQTLEENPQAVYDALAAQLGIQQAANPNATPQGNPTDEGTQLPPGYDQLRQGVEFMAQRMLNNEQARAEAEASQELISELQRIEAKHGAFNPDLFLPYLSAGLDKGLTVDAVAENYFNAIGQAGQQNRINQPYAPNVLGANSGGGAGLPTQNIDVTKLNDSERKNLVVEMLKRQAQAG